VEQCSEVLYVHLAKGSQLTQSLGLSLVKHLRYPSTIYLLSLSAHPFEDDRLKSLTTWFHLNGRFFFKNCL